MSTKLKMTGTQYRVLGKSNRAFSKLYNIATIPRYMVYNTKGVLVSESFLRPSDKKFKAELLKILKP